MDVSAELPRSRQTSGTAFPTTHWSIVLQAGTGPALAARTALEQLCATYWYPVYGFVRRQGRSHHEAEDLTQSLFVKLLAADGFARARPERGRFRTFLLSSLRNFMINDWERTRAAKRGGGEAPLSLNFADGDRHFTYEPVDEGLTPEQAYDRSWALHLIEHALEGLHQEYTASGRGLLFEALAPAVWGGGPTESLPAMAGRLGLQPTALKVALHRLRKRLRDRLCVHVRATVEEDGDIAAELSHLITAVGKRSSR